MASWRRITAVSVVTAIILLLMVVCLPIYYADRVPTAADILRDVSINQTTAEFGSYFQQDKPIFQRRHVMAPLSSRRQRLLNFLSDWRMFYGAEQVLDGVYFAFSKSYVNTIIVDGPEGLIVVDTTESRETAADIYRQLRTITSKPIKAVIYTHSHVDHVQGTQAFVEDASRPPDIWAFHTAVGEMRGNMALARRMSVTAAYQFGTHLGHAKVFARLPQGLRFTPTLVPNRLIRNDIEQTVIAGLNVTFIHVPGETDDHIAVWLEDKKVLMPGDNIYRSFPNIYAIRGSPARDALQWAESIRKMRSLQAEYLLPSHSDPVSGRQEIENLFTVYASAIQYIHDQTVRHMNELRHPDEIARMVRLPPDLASHPYLGEFYGKVEWSSKAIYQRYAGWFSGDPVELMPLTPSEKSQRLVDLIGIDRLLYEAGSSLKVGDAQWSLELSSHILRVQPNNRRAKDLRVQALKLAAPRDFNACRSNYYLTAALDTFGLIDVKMDPRVMIQHTPVGSLLNVMKVQLKAERTHGVNESLLLRLQDSNKTFSLHLEYSVLTVDEVSNIDDKVKVKDDEDGLLVTTTERVWKAVMFGLLPPATAYNNGQLRVTPDNRIDAVQRFLSYF